MSVVRPPSADAPRWVALLVLLVGRGLVRLVGRVWPRVAACGRACGQAEPMRPAVAGRYASSVSANGYRVWATFRDHFAGSGWRSFGISTKIDRWTMRSGRDSPVGSRSGAPSGPPGFPRSLIPQRRPLRPVPSGTRPAYQPGRSARDCPTAQGTLHGTTPPHRPHSTGNAARHCPTAQGTLHGTAPPHWPTAPRTLHGTAPRHGTPATGTAWPRGRACRTYPWSRWTEVTSRS